jgi:hypothetical protein
LSYTTFDNSSTDRRSPYTYSWPTYEYGGGSHKLKVVNVSGGQTLDSDQVTVKLKRGHLYVDDDANPDGVGKKSDPAPTLSKAAFLSSAGDTIYIAAGYYHDSYDAVTPYGTKRVCAKVAGSVSLIGDAADRTTIDCSGSDVGLFYSEGDSGGVILGLTIRNAGEACVYITEAEPRIERCILEQSAGDGIMFRDCERKITKIFYSEIRSNAGSGINMRNADLQVYYSLIQNNGASGVHCERWAFPRLRMVNVSGNEVGVFVDTASGPNITRCDVYDNEFYDLELGHGQLLDTLYFREIWWGVTGKAEVEERIYHMHDDPRLPFVDYGKWLGNPIFPQPENVK